LSVNSVREGFLSEALRSGIRLRSVTYMGAVRLSLRAGGRFRVRGFGARGGGGER
jgi:hypothetical protein